MTASLLSIGAKSPEEDEQKIAAGYYKNWQAVLVAGIPMAATTYFGDTKDVVAVGAVLIVWAIFCAEARLYDLCIRLRRTNLLINAQISNWDTTAGRTRLT